ncbi:signal transduction histidine kinase (plasmid) [Methylobacterium aquaticum]|uniref:Signal transduction histidine kinase n=1 Tax=Methylobacterium aquaticum TaxID=270351 RepID=A0A0C6FBD3_9HYPH|nr:signal transduction histidine kinase [Methylobacterium aquaticum]
MYGSSSQAWELTGSRKGDITRVTRLSSIAMMHHPPDSIRVHVADPARLAALEERDVLDMAPAKGLDDAVQIARPMELSAS